MKKSPHKFLQTITVLNVIQLGWKMKKISDTEINYVSQTENMDRNSATLFNIIELLQIFTKITPTQKSFCKELIHPISCKSSSWFSHRRTVTPHSDLLFK